MPRKRKGRKTRRRQPKALLNISEFVMLGIQGSQLTEMFFNTNLKTFLMGDTKGQMFGNAYGTSSLSLKELLTGQTGTSVSTWDIVKKNFQSNWDKQIIPILLTPFAFKGIKTVFRKPIATVNRQLRDIGMGSLVKL